MATNPIIRIGTRGSKLALWQAHFMQAELEKLQLDSELEIIKTQGDKIQHLSLDKLEGKGFFTKELEDALLRGDVHVAVHSMKDLPTTMPPGLILAGVSQRANPTDWILVRKEVAVDNKPWHLPSGAKVGTSSARRKSQLLDLRPDVTTEDIRGNVPTRIQKLRDGGFDAIILAAAGITRLQLDVSDLIVSELHPREFVPAPAQGVLAYQCREGDLETRRIIAKLHNAATSTCTNVERTLLKRFDGGCHLPLGAHCVAHDMGFNFTAAYAPKLGEPVIRKRLSLSTFDGLVDEMYNALTAEIPA